MAAVLITKVSAVGWIGQEEMLHIWCIVQIDRHLQFWFDETE